MSRYLHVHCMHLDLPVLHGVGVHLITCANIHVYTYMYMNVTSTVLYESYMYVHVHM